MRYILTASQMQQCDRNTIEHYGIPSSVLMERAALATVEEIEKLLPGPGASILVACGSGNNGGDGLAIARMLHIKGYVVDILLADDMGQCSDEAARQLDVATKYGVSFLDEIPEYDTDCIVDALFGIGLSRNVEGAYADMIDALNARPGVKVSVDMPSGVNADDGHIMGTAFMADLTVTFGFVKMGQLIYPGASCVGELVIKDEELYTQGMLDVVPSSAIAEVDDLGLLPVRSNDSNKGTFGKILIFAGSKNMAGAAVFAAKAAYRMGAGLVKVVTEESNRTILQLALPEAILATYDDATDMKAFVKEQLAWADAVVAGPGIGQTRQSLNMVAAILANVAVPCVLDADALNILAANKDTLLAGEDGDISAPIVVTPHPGEMARLMDCDIAQVKDDVIGVAKLFAAQCDVVTVLKGASTVTAKPDGETWIFAGGNDGMATAGSGDVLTGIIAALMAQGMEPDDAAIMGVLVHGLAGDVAAEEKGSAAVMATDIVEGIGEVLKIAAER